VSKGFDVISKLAKLGCKAGGLNPKIAAHLWETVALPHLLYGCELWYLKNQYIKELERVLNVFCRITQCLIPGSSGSAARGTLGLNCIYWAESLTQALRWRIESCLSENLLNGNGGRAIPQCQGLSLIL
jgi:hypothetical protein